MKTILISIAVLGFTAGFLTGGSATPVIGVILPAIVAIAAAVIATFSKAADVAKSIKPSAYGAAVLLFSAPLLIGSIAGAKARAENWFFTPATRDYPWPNGQQPKSVVVAQNLIVLQGELISRGYSEERVQNFFTMFQEELDSDDFVNLSGGLSVWADSIQLLIDSAGGGGDPEPLYKGIDE